VCTDLHGQTTIPGLLAVGEVACTGLHGANRLASNSLLEGLVFGYRAAQHAAEVAAASPPALQVPDWNPGHAVPPEEGVIVKQNWDEIRALMWNYVGIVRTDKRLARAEHRLDNLVGEIQEYYWGYLLTRDIVELRNLADVARLIVACAQERKESRGLHYTLSWPGADPSWVRDTVLVRGKPAPEAWPRD
jgi:L-aspartate oxidase